MKPQKKAWQTMKKASPQKKSHYTIHRKVGALKAVIKRQKKLIASLQSRQ